MKIHNEVQQGSNEWLALHIGKPTASEFHNLVDTKFEQRNGAMPHTYLCKKVAEAYRGQPLPGFGSWATEQGQILEEEARAFYDIEYGERVEQVGFVEDDLGRFGCSPDGLIGDDGGIEIKCPETHTHVSYLLKGTLPNDYSAQVHFSIFVTGRKWWKFFSYRRKFPPLLLTIQRDEEIMAKIQKSMDTFQEKFTTSLTKIKAMA